MFYQIKAQMYQLLDSRCSRDIQRIVFFLYIPAGLWCLAAFGFLVLALIAAPSAVVVIPKEIPLNKVFGAGFNSEADPYVRPSPGGSRDPFQYGAVKGSLPGNNTVGLHNIVVKGVIFSQKIGVLLENAATGTAALLSEGEMMGNVLVKKVTKDTVTLFQNGQESVVAIGRKP